jgi:hypothetical protein
MNTLRLAPLALAALSLSSACIIIDKDGDDDLDDVPCVDCGVGGATSGGPGAGGSPSAGPGAGGAEVCDPTELACPCAEDGTCGEGEACVLGACVPGCNFDAECPGGTRCAEGQCLPACDAGACAEGASCVGGACIPDAAGECGEDAPCAEGVCVEGRCAEACASHADCGEDELCNAATGACQADLGPAPSCTDAAPCSGIGQSCVDGMCRYPCADLTECKLVDARFAACEAGVCLGEREASPTCTLSIVCPDGELCVSNACVAP